VDRNYPMGADFLPKD
jgi:hypothetical protein